MRFVTPEIEKELNDNVVSSVFPNMAFSDRNMISKYYTRLIDVISYAYGFDTDMNRNNFIIQLRLNNYRDATGILYLLLPFINDSADKSEIKSFNDIYTKKTTNIDISSGEPKYQFSNIQYGRCIRDNVLKEIQFDESHILHNFYLLCDTVRLMSYKSYTNWINIVPYTQNEINSVSIEFLRNTENELTASNIQSSANNLKYYDFNPVEDIAFTNINDTQLKKKLNRIQIDDIYDIITNDLYYAIKDVKWLIYEFVIDKIRYPINTFLVDFFGSPYNQTIHDIEWDLLTEDDKNIFIGQFDKLKDALKSNKPLSSTNFKLSKEDIRTISKDIILFFNNHYLDVNKAVKNKEYMFIKKLVNTDDFNDEIQSYSELNFDDVKDSIYSLKANHLYEFFRYSVQQFIDTYYGKYTLAKYETKFRADMYNGIITGDENVKITLKNVYNFAKSFCHTNVRTRETTLFTPLPKYWRSLTYELRQKIFDRLTNKSPDNWFDISRYIKKFIIDVKDGKAVEYMKKMREILLHLIINMSVITLCAKGVFTKFIFNHNLTDESMIPADKRRSEWPKKLKPIIFDNEQYGNTNYFLTGKPYKSMKNVTYKDREQKERNEPYFDYNSKDGWYVAYALDWVSQISFFHKYLNNRIIYVTGSTGVGKSTQIPKLILYAVKAIDYKNISTVVCTQPRLTPATGNARQVSLEMGVPIGEAKDSESSAKNTNYNIQFKTGKSSHIKKIPKVVLKFVTDGLLNMELSNPLVKTTSRVKEKQNKLDTVKYKYRPENIYDVIMVDEAHEHNANMDLILTYMKYAASYNNSIKLVIISATMEDDEPNYRRYYRNINDNKMYPLNFMLSENKLDRINIDRRLHISPPGQTTRFKIDEHYFTDIKLNCNKLTKKSLPPLNRAVELIVKLALQNSTNKQSDILFFQPGLMELQISVKELNKVLPDYALAVPFHGQMKQNTRSIVEAIHKNKDKIHLSKDADFESVDPTKGSNSYTTLVIVATNIAEASLTIDTLKYVIETGTQKTSEYDYRNKNSVLKLTCISESSRLQRKGRVGRTAAGSVYYLYDKGTMENNKTQFNIAIQNINAEIYRRMADIDEQPIFTDSNNPDKPLIKINESLYPDNMNNGVWDVIRQQYFVLDTYYEYYGNTDHYDYINYKPLPDIYKSGFTLNTLIDNDGSHYIIHPEELLIRRNITGQIIGLKPLVDNNRLTFVNNILVSNKIYSFIDDLKAYLFFAGTNYSNMVKTKLGIMMFKYKETLKLESMSHFISYLYSKIYDCEEQMIRFIAMSSAISRTNISKLVFSEHISNNKLVSDMDKHKPLHNNSDITYLLTLVDIFHKFIESQNIHLDLENDVYYSNYAYNPNITDKKQQYNKFRLDGHILNFMSSKIKTISTHITSLCQKLYINPKFIMSYLEKYIEIKNNVYCANTDNVNPEQEIIVNDLIQIMKPLANTTIKSKDKFTACLLMGYPYNILFNMINTPYYVSIYNPVISNIYKLKTSGFGKKITGETLIESRYTKRFMLYINVDIEDNSVALLHYIKPELLGLISNIYSVAYIKNKYNSLMASKLKIDAIETSQATQISASYNRTLLEIKIDLLNNYNYNTQLKLSNVDPSYAKYVYQNRDDDIKLLDTV